MLEADAILTSDWHLREDIPICRTDDFWTVQWNKIQFVAELQKKYKCPVIHAGDLYNHWKPSPYLLTETIKWLPRQFRTIYGQHDLPQHNLELANKCGIFTLAVGRHLETASGTDFGEMPDPNHHFMMIKGRKMCIWHRLVWMGRIPWPGCKDPSVDEVLNNENLLSFDLIITGDNHKPFVYQSGDRLLVNPGSLTRQTADQVKHKPRVYLWYAKTNTVEPVYIPIVEGVISREHIDEKTERDDRINAFISKFNTTWELGLDFEENLKQFIQENNLSKSVIAIIYQAIEKEP